MQVIYCIKLIIILPIRLLCIIFILMVSDSLQLTNLNEVQLQDSKISENTLKLESFTLTSQYFVQLFVLSKRRGTICMLNFNQYSKKEEIVQSSIPMDLA